MGVAASPDPSCTTPAAPENAAPAAGVRISGLQLAPISEDIGGTTTNTTATTPATTAGSPGTDNAETSTNPPWRLLCARHKNSSVFAGCKLASAKISPGDEEEALDDIETGSTSSVDTFPISPETIKAAAAAAPAGSGARGIEAFTDLEAGKQAANNSDDNKCVQSVSFLGRLLMIYSDALDKRPVITKSLSSGLIGLLGDLLAQSVEWGLGGGAVPWSGTKALWRSCAVMMDGFFINGPLLHYCYEFLEMYMPAEKSILAAVLQVAVDVFIIDPVFGFIFVWSTGLFEGRSVKPDILTTLEHHYPTMVMWLIVIGLAWAPLQVYLFNRYPVQFRVLMADIIDLVWTCVSSFFCHVR